MKTETDQRDLILKCFHDRIYYCKNKSVDVEATSLSYLVHNYSFIYWINPIYWQVQLLKVDKKLRHISVQILDYDADKEAIFEKQKTGTQLKFIHINKFDNSKVTNNWFGEKTEDTKPLEHNSLVNELDDVSDEEDDDKPTARHEPEQKKEVNKPVVKIIQPKPFTFHFSDARFHLGYIQLSEFVDELGRNFDFRIYNENLLPEFEIIKPGIIKLLKRKTFDVIPTAFKTIDGKPDVPVIKASSKVIERINHELIKIVKQHRIKSLTSQPDNLNPDKSLFTSDEVYSAFKAEEEVGNMFRENESELLHILCEEYKVRNYKQLQYLADMHSKSRKLPFHITLQPHFGFLFFFAGNEMHHFIWELLNSNSTYIWSADKNKGSVENQYRHVEQVINQIREINRTNYKRNYKQNSNTNFLVFNEVRHNKITSDFIDAFVIWKNRINELLF